MKTRREFLQTCAAISGAAALPAAAQTLPNFKALVCVFLFGGNDSNNIIVPMDTAANNEYRAGRGQVALANNVLLPIQAQGRAYGLHPRFTDLQALYNQRRMAIVANVGTLVQPTTKATLNNTPLPRNLYSHSDQQTQWQSGNPMGSTGTGWAGRAADVLRFSFPSNFTPAISLAGNSLFLTGIQTVPANLASGAGLGLETIDLNDKEDKARFDSMQKLMTFDSGITMIGAASGVLNRGLDNGRKIAEALANPPVLTTVFPNTGIGNQLRQAAQLVSIHSRLNMSRQIFFASHGGYDNHESLLNNQDGRLAELAPAMVAFYRAMVELNLADKVTLFTESEFNRTFNSNSTNGSDHAWGGHQIVLGGAVRGGEMYGTFPRLVLRGPDDAGDRGLWIPSTALDQFASTLSLWFGVQPSDLPQVFPNIGRFATSNLGFMA